MDNLPAALKNLYPERLSIWETNQTEIISQMTELLHPGNNAIVTPTKVGYIVMTCGQGGLEKKFKMKGRPKSKPGVVLCSSMEQLEGMAEVNEKIIKLYTSCWEKNILLGCILPWKKEAADALIPKDGSIDMVQDTRGTSCFVIKYGEPSEQIAKSLWDTYRTLSFASSANPSGKGNRGKLEHVGENIIEQADHLVYGDEYVERQQPGKSIETRWEQGVMVSMVDETGNLEKGMPTIIRHGLALDLIKQELTAVYGEYKDQHGAYH